MSYGSNLPWGLQATKTLGSATWNGQTNPYLINTNPGATNQSIFRGDPVALLNGYLVSLYQIDNNNYGTVSILGVFDGCSYINVNGVNPTDPASPGRAYWPVGTQTPNNVPATAAVIDDPNTIFNIQVVGDVGALQTNMGATAPVAFDLDGTTVLGNTTTGISRVGLDSANIDTNALLNLKLIRLVAYPGNISGLQYNNVEVLIQNHFYCSRPAGI